MLKAMKILVVGSGGREHALVSGLRRNSTHHIYALPGNPGMARTAHCIPAPELSPQTILDAADSVNADLTVIGPEAPLVAGVVDLFRASARRIVGCTQEAAQLEGSKVFAKRFFETHGIPTAQFVTADDRDEAVRALARFSFPVVIKADGLAAGKGVVIAYERAQALGAIDSLGPRLVIEEFLEGPEVSFIAVCDGRNCLPFLPSRDHKRVFDRDQGPNTGGMGAFCDASLLSEAETDQVLNTIIRPTVQATSFTGFLYAGLILTSAGPKILEFNVRLGDPETQAILPHLATRLPDLLLASTAGALDECEMEWKPGASLCVVLAAAGYPGSVRTGDLIEGVDDAESSGATVFHAGTKFSWGGCVTAGGRVLSVGASGADVREAAEHAYAGVDKIRFAGMQFRRDIGRPYDKATGT